MTAARWCDCGPDVPAADGGDGNAYCDLCGEAVKPKPSAAKVYEPCVACRGTGEWDETRECPSCGGTGEVVIPLAVGEQIPMKCAACGKPHPGLDRTASWPRSYVCPCGSSQFKTVVTFGA